MLSVKQGSIKYHFLSLWYDSNRDLTQVSQAIGEHSNHYANTQEKNRIHLLSPELLHFILDPYLIMLSVKQGSIKYHFLSLWYDSNRDLTQVSQDIGENSNHYANTLEKNRIHFGVVAIKNGAFRLPLITVANFTLFLYNLNCGKIEIILAITFYITFSIFRILKEPTLFLLSLRIKCSHP